MGCSNIGFYLLIFQIVLLFVEMLIVFRSIKKHNEACKRADMGESMYRLWRARTKNEGIYDVNTINGPPIGIIIADHINKEDINDLKTWVTTCNICQEKRRFDDLNVRTIDLNIDNCPGFGQRNLRYCKDKIECFEAAKSAVCKNGDVFYNE